MSARPMSVIASDVEVVRLGLNACKRVAHVLLAERHDLLAEGWPTSHALCTELDKDAARWAAHAEQMRRSLLALREELDPALTHQPEEDPE